MFSSKKQKIFIYKIVHQNVSILRHLPFDYYDFIEWVIIAYRLFELDAFDFSMLETTTWSFATIYRLKFNLRKKDI